jgi:hypothetical protein
VLWARVLRVREVLQGGEAVTLADVLSSPWFWVFTPLYIIALSLLVAWFDDEI